MLFPPNRDFITSGKNKELVADVWLDWFMQITSVTNFISPIFSGGQTASLDMTQAPGLIKPWPGFLILSWSTVASPLTLTLPVAPKNSIIVVARPAAGGSALTISGSGGPWTLAASTWITLVSDGTNWNKIMTGSL
jgi:hypothetical protein